MIETFLSVVVVIAVVLAVLGPLLTILPDMITVVREWKREVIRAWKE